jgi:hypothetical protein
MKSSSMFWAKMEPWPPAQEPENENGVNSALH